MKTAREGSINTQRFMENDDSLTDIYFQIPNHIWLSNSILNGHVILFFPMSFLKACISQN